MTRRKRQVEHLLRDEISDLLRYQLKDPRLEGLVTVTGVSTSADMKEARVFISVLGDDEEKGKALQGFSSAAGFLRRELAKRVSMRHIPELSFEKDDSIEKGIRLSQLIEKVSAEDRREQS